jgi:hypothetical protein
VEKLKSSDGRMNDEYSLAAASDRPRARAKIASIRSHATFNLRATATRISRAHWRTLKGACER